MAAMPDLAEITNALFGGLVDVDALVAKMDPGVSDVHVLGGDGNRAGTPPLVGRATGRRRRTVRKFQDQNPSPGKKALALTGITATGIGGALGFREVGDAASELGHPGISSAVSRGIRMIPTGARTVLKNPKIRLGAVGGMLAGDAIATGEQVRHMRRRQQVNKTFTEQVDGFIRNSRFMSTLHAPELVQPGAAPKAMKANGTDKAIASGQRAGEDVRRFAGTTSGKVAIGGAGLLAVHSGVKRRRNRDTGYEPMPYAKRDVQDVTFTGTFSKFDDEKRLAFGWANVSKVDGLPVIDRQGDYCSIEDIEEAAYTYVEQSRVGGDMHKRVGGKADGSGDRPHHVADLVESMIFDDAKCDALGLGEEFPRGWWVGFRVFDDDVWEMAKDGRRTGFSIHGRGIRKSVDYDALMGVT